MHGIDSPYQQLLVLKLYRPVDWGRDTLCYYTKYLPPSRVTWPAAVWRTRSREDPRARHFCACLVDTVAGTAGTLHLAVSPVRGAAWGELGEGPPRLSQVPLVLTLTRRQGEVWGESTRGQKGSIKGEVICGANNFPLTSPQC